MSEIAGIESEVLFRLESVPVHSCELFGSPSAALSCPTGTIELAADPSSGLISNRRFDPQTQAFSGRYEETQAYSAHFSAYARNLAERLIADHALAGKRILEIGCGKGYFLVELCRMAGAAGTGIDPSITPDRLAGLDDADVTFLAERLAPRHGDLDFDFLICRHTLEHIAEPVEFLRIVHQTLRGRPVPFYLDVPDATRILREGAFWDVYYEHSQYFTPGSLSAVMSAAGFDIVDLHREYDDQFLCATALPTGRGDHGTPMNVCTGDSAQTFPVSVNSQIDAWRHWFAERAGQTVAIWGAGSKAVAFLSTLGRDADVACAVDINPYKAGTFIPGSGRPVIGPSALPGMRPDHIVIMNPVYGREIAAAVAEMGLTPTLWTVGALPLRPLPFM